MRTKEDARALIDAVKKVPLGFYPTPFHKLERMSELTGVNLWVKREDFSRVCNFLWAARSRLIDVGGDSVTK